jgi:DNA-binding response OmpR family regulator
MRRVEPPQGPSVSQAIRRGGATLRACRGIVPRSQGRTRTLDSHASRLRRKLGCPASGRFVVNVWGVGYRLLDD